MSLPTVHIADGIATITLNRPKSLNALKQEDYNVLAHALREIDAREDVLVTVWQATGRWFCAGTDVRKTVGNPEQTKPFNGSVRRAFLENVSGTHTDVGHALLSHRKILVAALNGPVMGIAAAFLGHFDFIYCTPDAWLSVPFTFLGIIAEGGSSASFIQRMGVTKANEVLLFGKRKEAEELRQCGFVNQIFESENTDSFHKEVRAHILEELRGLDPSALMEVRKLLRAALKDQNDPEGVLMRETFAQATRFASDIPRERFAKIARKEIRHKL